ncbi:MAG: SDR family oxidoreductase [Oscillospiraceae bacterium]|nr:SDR family oxidoreductase [Oscillospiraceae bacterium]
MARTTETRENKIALVTGGSSGIGLSTVRRLASAGCTVYEFSRHEPAQGANKAVHFSVDVTKEDQVQAAVRQIAEQAGRIDLVVNCAGYGISGAVEFTELDQAKSQFDVNFFGMVNVNKAVLPHMREQRSGRIINISSVAAPAAIPFQTFYSASKAAINSYTCALANEVRPFGISVAAVMPGDIHTGFTEARNKSLAGDQEYDGRISKSVAKMEHDELNGMSPDRVARRVRSIAFKHSVKPLYSVGFSYQLICVLCQILPCRLSNWIIGLLYG